MLKAFLVSSMGLCSVQSWASANDGNSIPLAQHYSRKGEMNETIDRLRSERVRLGSIQERFRLRAASASAIASDSALFLEFHSRIDLCFNSGATSFSQCFNETLDLMLDHDRGVLLQEGGSSDPCDACRKGVDASCLAKLKALVINVKNIAQQATAKTAPKMAQIDELLITSANLLEEYSDLLIQLSECDDKTPEEASDACAKTIQKKIDANQAMFDSTGEKIDDLNEEIKKILDDAEARAAVLVSEYIFDCAPDVRYRDCPQCA